MVLYKTAIVDGLSVFYREAGKPGSPKLVLLGGFPASSHQFRNLIPALADRFHVLSPTTRASATPTCRIRRPSRTPSTTCRKSWSVCSSKTGFTRAGLLHAGLRRSGRLPDSRSAARVDGVADSPEHKRV